VVCQTPSATDAADPVTGTVSQTGVTDGAAHHVGDRAAPCAAAGRHRRLMTGYRRRLGWRHWSAARHLINAETVDYFGQAPRNSQYSITAQDPEQLS